MRILTITVVLAAYSSFNAPAVNAQLSAMGPVVNGHHHLNVSDVDAHLHFWVETLGGEPGTFGSGTQIVLFPDALVFLREQAPTRGSIGTTVNHVGFTVPDLRAVLDRLSAGGYTIITAEESPPGAEVVDGIRVVPGGGAISGIAYVLGPDDVKVEFLEMRAQSQPLVSHHIHFFGDEAEQMRAWYVEMFGAAAQPDAGTGFVVATLPGLSLNFTDTESSTAATQGTVIDHIGFEVDGLAELVERLEAKGIVPDVPYREIPAAGIALAFITDPWGTYIELTEGLDEIGN